MKRQRRRKQNGLVVDIPTPPGRPRRLYKKQTGEEVLVVI
jgi:hypothetical protein